MRIEIKIPNVGESITEVEIGEWFKSQGDSVTKNESLLLLETDKASMEISAPESGTLVEILKKNGESASIGEVIARLETKTNGAARAPASENEETRAEPKPEPAAAEPRRHEKPADASENVSPAPPVASSADHETSTDLESLPEDASEREAEIIGAKEMLAQQVQDAEPSDGPIVNAANLDETASPSVGPLSAGPSPAPDRRDDIVPMSLLRRRIAERLVAAQQNAALLTTFNEIDMSAVSDLRKSLGEAFKEKHRIKLGFMSFFVKAAVAALQSVREVNAEINGDNIVYHNYCDIGVAVGGGRGLVVPVLRHAERMSFAEIERAIDDFAHRARDNQLKPDELQGGTFTITNGGVYGSLFSTPIINPPQSAILGLHAIQERPVAREGQLAVRPMMYVALSYDHRIIDGREAVLFLKQIKSMIEEPARILLEF
ncbi:MAG: 2-oxoglutarate dehydrogenase complex dihydrolipoyllysine-residue succinyltransferase [Candidatus Binatia bacterium]